MSEASFREMTQDERERLEEELERARANPVSVPQALAAAAGVVGASFYRPSIALLVLLALSFGLLPGWATEWLVRAALGTALVVAGGIGALVITANRAWVGFLTRLHRNAERDLAKGRVQVRWYRPRAAIALEVDAETPLGHVLELEGRLLLFVPAALSRSCAGFPAARVELASAPASQVFVSARGEGALLAAPARALAARVLALAVSRPCQPVPGTLSELPDGSS